ncbi:MAG: hypothetical protein WA484_01250 [Solirubrobacteraceae bacterium]
MTSASARVPRALGRVERHGKAAVAEVGDDADGFAVTIHADGGALSVW